jgi:pyruvate dehydrogenase E1 component
VIQLAASGAVMPDVLAAAEELSEEGVCAHVVDITCAGRLCRDWQQALRTGIRSAALPSFPGSFGRFKPGVPVVTVHDAASHALAWLGSAQGTVSVPLGVDQFGQSGSIHDLYGLHVLLPPSIVNAALAAVELHAKSAAGRCQRPGRPGLTGTVVRRG